MNLLHLDQALDAIEMLEALLTTQIHIVLRFVRYLGFPTQLWKLTRAFNRDGLEVECMKFLYVPGKDLDADYSLLLQQSAWAAGDGDSSESAALDYLTSDEQQED